ncbi:LOW QUALITY PROTEIN: hypothetical protein ACHAXA_006336 [Cyclostephanos tholiformis]|uniref:N-acetyltransferase domain-containing protein n=1 Tax=Cyclostephanos tholiformis TaxID=382380 RepID=A0ABD3RX18_9STRA
MGGCADTGGKILRRCLLEGKGGRAGRIIALPIDGHREAADCRISQEVRRQRRQEERRRRRSVGEGGMGGGGTRLPGNYATRAAGGGVGGGSSSPPSSRTRGRRAELVLCVADVGDRGNRNPGGGGGGSTTAIIGCAGIEIDRVRKMDGYDTKIIGPVMSNLAIGREYRRRGLAENLVIAVEDIASREWGYDVCYLYVEKRNIKARKLYEKLGYEVIWEDDTATTLLPARGGGDGGGLISGRTTIVCMRKDLAEGRGMMGMKNIALSFGSLFSRR